MSDEQRIAEIRARLAEASRFERPWYVSDDEDWDPEVLTADSWPGIKTVICEVGQYEKDGSSPLAEFLAHAPEDIEWLLDRLPP